MKKVLSLILACAVVLGIVMVPAAQASAASGYPSAVARKAQYDGEAGTTSTACEYDITYCFYKYEKMVIETFDGSGTKVTSKTKSFYNTDREVNAGPKRDVITYSLIIPSGYPAGTMLTIVAKMQYSTDGTNYTDAPNAQTTTFVVQGKSTHINEYVNGRWYDANGKQSDSATLVWQGGGNNWYVMDTKGWYPQSRWLKIDGYWYYFTASGWMDYSEYRDGTWLNADGTASTVYTNGTWHHDANGWWYSDGNWYPRNQYLWIDGTQYWFNASGYIQ